MAIEDFVSKDRKTISLPIPLGNIVYKTNSSCGDFCVFDKKRFDKNFPPTKNGRCSQFNACHTRYKEPIELIVTPNCLDVVLDGWGVTIFATYDEAKSVADARVDEHRKIMTELGFKMKENGHAYMIDKD